MSLQNTKENGADHKYNLKGVLTPYDYVSVQQGSGGRPPVEFMRRAMGASAVIWETRAGGVLAKKGNKLAFFTKSMRRTHAANASVTQTLKQ